MFPISCASVEKTSSLNAVRPGLPLSLAVLLWVTLFPNSGDRALLSQDFIPPPITAADQVLNSLEKIYDDFWEYQLSVSPMLAAEHGDKAAQGKLPQSGLKTIDRDLKKYFSLLHRLMRKQLESLVEQD